MSVITRNEFAVTLARDKYDEDEDIRAIYRLTAEAENDPGEPVSLLIVSDEYERPAPTSVLPLYFEAHPERGLLYPYTLAIVLPVEFERVVNGEIALLPGYTLGSLLFSRVSSEQVAA